ncbi:MAG: hypothetical protein KBT32_08270 [Bacteroidales bacterium]|nr:hypothetical protein [Candidatus Physcocola equi]
MDAILSIKPQFVDEIVAGRKKYEFRKKGFKEQVNKIYVYASSPVCKIIGEFLLGNILEGDPDRIWALTSAKAGISREYFDEYYEQKKVAYALEITSFVTYKDPINPYETIAKFSPPQSFCYIRNGIENRGKTLFPHL